ncbi:MAG: FimV/HubP family polar landmark protein [Gammaproteobacteria bacterium]
MLAVAFAPQSWSLGLGEIELDSALNQEFKATIELTDASGLEPGEILVSLGSSEDFQRVGVERFFFLTDLDFEVDYGPNGDPVIRITSGRPITEPYLNFLVEVHWPNGRLLKEFTVLLDPPTFSQAAAPAVSAPAQERAPVSTGRVERVAPATSGTRVQMAPTGERAQPSPLDRGLVGDEYGMTDRDDTLWSIASRARPSNAVSVQQTMLAIQRMNPEAFINGNINLLKAGYTLKLPDEAAAQSISAQEALGEVARHHEEWQAYNRGELVADRSSTSAAPAADQTSTLRSPVDASATTTPATSAPATDGELKIVAEDGDSTTGVGGQASSADLDAAMEETDRLGRQVDELTYQLDREKELASNEIAMRERQIEVKDKQIAELQAQLATARQTAQAPTPQPDESATATETETEAQNQNQSTSDADAPWWQSSIVMYGGAGVLVLLLAGGMIMARRRRAEEEEDDYFDATEAFADDERLEPVLDTESDEDFDDDRTAVLASGDVEEAFDEELEESQTSDVIGEADIYIAYGRFPQAIGLLLGVLEDEPERNDVRMKLLEVYAETGDRAEIDKHMAALIEHCDDEEALLAARELESRFGEETLTLDDVMAGEESEPTETAVDGDTSDNVSSILGSSTGVAAAEQDETAAKESPASLDFELELDELEDGASTDRATGEDDSAAARGAGDQLGGDLGIDFNPDADKESAEADMAATELSTEADERPSVNFEPPSDSEDATDFVATEELTIDAELEKAAASISTEASSASAEDQTERDDVATAVLDDLEFESSAAGEEDFDFQDEGDSANTKLDLARAYIDMGDADGARDILKEVLDEGNADQQQKAQSMLEAL